MGPLAVAVMGLLVGGFVAVRNLGTGDPDPTVFVGFGEQAVETLEYGRALLGEVAVRKAQGHDGKFFFVQANDPFYLEPNEHAVNLDRPLYRAQRMLYPAFAGGFGALPPRAVAWGMLGVNIAALGFGAWATAAFARQSGWSPWWGLAFPLNPGILSEMTIGGAGILAFSLAMWGLVAIQAGRPGWAAVSVSGAVLSREAFLLMVATTGFWWWRRHRTLPWAAVLVPPLAAGLWAVYLRIRIGDLKPDAVNVQEVGLPLKGFFEAFPRWVDNPINLVTGVLIAAVLLVFAIRTVLSDDLLAWSAIGFVPLAAVFTRQVWTSYFDISRAVAPVLTAWVVVTFAGRSRHAWHSTP